MIDDAVPRDLPLDPPLDLGLSPAVDRGRPEWFDTIDWRAVTRHEVEPESLVALRYMSLVEGQTPGYLLHAMMSRIVRADPDATDFLSAWAHQEMWHSIALHAFRDLCAGREVSTRHQETATERRSVNAWERWGWLGSLVADATMARTFAAVYGTIGTMNELTARHAYASLRDKTTHPVLATLVDLLMREEAQHAAWYQRFAAEQLERSKAAQWATRQLLTRRPTIVGEGFRGRADADRLIVYLHEGTRGEIAPAVDAAVARLPGLEGIQPMQLRIEQALDATGARPRTGLAPAPAH
jgi:hypothetical protein